MSGEFTIVICTRARPGLLARTLAALDAGTFRDFPIVIVDQSDEPDAALDACAAGDERLEVHRSGDELRRFNQAQPGSLHNSVGLLPHLRRVFPIL